VTHVLGCIGISSRGVKGRIGDDIEKLYDAMSLNTFGTELFIKQL